MAVDESFDKQFFNKYLGKRLKIIRGIKNITFEALADKVGVSYSYLVNMFNGRQIASLEKWEDVAKGLGVSEIEFKSLVRDAKKAEYESTTGEEICTIPEINLNTLEGLDLDNEELIKVVMKREFGKEPTAEDIQTILSVIRMKK